MLPFVKDGMSNSGCVVLQGPLHNLQYQHVANIGEVLEVSLKEKS